MDDKLQKIDKDTKSVINQTFDSLIEGMTGIAASKKKDIVLSVSSLIQNLRAGYGLKAFITEWEQFKKQGKIKDDYDFTEQHKNCLHEFLNFLDNDIPDELRFSVMKKICIVAATEEITDRDSLLPDQYIKICKKLSSGAVLILLSTYKIVKNNEWDIKAHHATQSWMNNLAKESKLNYPELVEIYETELVKNLLLTKRMHGDGSGIYASPNYRLSTLGLDICKYIDKYDNVRPE